MAISRQLSFYGMVSDESRLLSSLPTFRSVCYNSLVHSNDIPLLKHPLGAPSAFTADSLVAAVRSERKLPSEAVPPVCLLEFDGDLTDWMVTAGHAQVYKNWACFHTVMHTIEVDGLPGWTENAAAERLYRGKFAVMSRWHFAIRATTQTPGTLRASFEVAP